jgi:hypothetical protein
MTAKQEFADLRRGFRRIANSADSFAERHAAKRVWDAMGQCAADPVNAPPHVRRAISAAVDHYATLKAGKGD